MDSTPPSKPSAVPVPKLKPKRKRRPPAVPWKKPKDMPRRPLSAYNLFFRQEREKMLKAGWKSSAKAAQKKAEDDDESDASEKAKTGGTGGFANLARTVAAKWKTLPAEEKAPFEQEAAREKARYDAQMLGWRAAQEQKKAQKAGGSQHMIEALTSGATLQAYAAQLGATQQQVDYPDAWFQAADPPRSDNVDAALHMLGLKEQQRALLIQQQQQLQNRVPELPMRTAASSAFAISGLQASANQMPMDIDRHLAQRQQLVPDTTIQIEDTTADKKLPAKLPGKPSLWPSDPVRNQPFQSSNPSSSYELRSELSPMRRPSLLEQRGSTLGAPTRPTMMEQRASLGDLGVGYQSQFRQLGDESSITAGMLQQSFFGASGGFQSQQRPPNFGEEPQRAARIIEHRSSIGMPPGYQPPFRQFEHAQRMVRSQSFPSSLSLSPKLPSPEDTRGKMPLALEPRGSSGLETPLTPRLQTSPHSTLHSIMNSPNMVPTPPQQGDTLMNSASPPGGLGTPRPLSAPPPNFPGDDEFQPIDTHRGRRQFSLAQLSQQDPTSNEPQEVGEIRLCEEMADQRQQNANLFQSTFEALDSEDAVDFLSNLKFDG